MKIIVTGATGFIGAAVVKSCIASPNISSIIVLSRREILKDLRESPKVKVVLHKDFSSYPESVLAQLEDAEGCIWAIGGKAQDFPDVETARKVGVDYTLAAAHAFARSLAGKSKSGKRFAFVFCSGQGAVQDQDAKVWFFSDTRKIKGAVEKGLFDIAEANSSKFDAFTLRPSGVLPESQKIANSMISIIWPMVLVQDLANALVTLCITRPEQKTLENKDILRIAKEGMSRS